MLDPKYAEHTSHDNSLVVDNGQRPSPYANYKFQDEVLKAP